MSGGADGVEMLWGGGFPLKSEGQGCVPIPGAAGRAHPGTTDESRSCCLLPALRVSPCGLQEIAQREERLPARRAEREVENLPAKQEPRTSKGKLLSSCDTARLRAHFIALWKHLSGNKP